MANAEGSQIGRPGKPFFCAPCFFFRPAGVPHDLVTGRSDSETPPGKCSVRVPVPNAPASTPLRYPVSSNLTSWHDAQYRTAQKMRCFYHALLLGTP